jgi:G3E family GTPase
LSGPGPRSLAARSGGSSAGSIRSPKWIDSEEGLCGGESRQTPDRTTPRFAVLPGFDQPFAWEGLNAALQALTALRGPDLLRVKGIVHVMGEHGPVVLQGAQHVFHPPVTLEGNEDTDPRSRIVFIVRNITRESIEALFAAVGALGNAKGA